MRLLMSTAGKIEKSHLSKTAIIYVRQSTQGQLVNHKESLELQYNLRSKAVEYGWLEKQITIIDEDLGVSGSGKVERVGFNELLLKVASGEVGIIFAYDATRLSRNCADWYGLLDICGCKGALIGDSDGIYNPIDMNDRLLLGLKGQLAEFELKTIRSRMRAGFINKVKKGEAYVSIPVGYVKSAFGGIEMDPNTDVRESIKLVFELFKVKKAISKVVSYFRENNIELIRRTRHGELVWRPATSAAISVILRNPAYGGIYAYGKSKNDNYDRPHDGLRYTWHTFIRDNHVGYITHDEYINNQYQINQNYADYLNRMSSGVPRQGRALLPGIICCGKCGHKMYTVYKENRYYYKCLYENQTQGRCHCALIEASQIDNAVSSAFIQAISVAEINAYNEALRTKHKLHDETVSLLEKIVERKEYEAGVREKQYLCSDPENRLVTARLEKNWEDALEHVDSAKSNLKKQLEQYDTEMPISENLKELFQDAGKKINVIWNENDLLSLPSKKDLLRTIIEQVNIKRIKRDTCEIRIVWKGGMVSELKQPLRVNSLKDLTDYDQFMDTFNNLYALGLNDKNIAETMTDMGFRGASSFDVSAGMVKELRLKLRMYNDKRDIAEDYLTVADIMKITGKGRSWVHYHINAGNISGVQDRQKHNIFLFPKTDEFINTIKNLGRLSTNEKVEQAS